MKATIGQPASRVPKLVQGVGFRHFDLGLSFQDGFQRDSAQIVRSGWTIPKSALFGTP